MRLLGHFIRLGTIAVVLLVSLAMATTTLAGGRPLFATLSGAAEVPGPGDPEGTGTVKLTLNGGRGQICFWIDVENITLPATAAHIHGGAAGVAGDVVVALAAPNEDGEAIGCVDAERSLIKAIRQHPRQYYVNVHTSDFPAGAVRGQLGWHAKPQ